MRITYDPNKRDRVLSERGIDMADAGRVFAGFHLTRSDEAYGDIEPRLISVGMLDSDVVIVVWTKRDNAHRIVTMWKANAKEREAYARHAARSD